MILLGHSIEMCDSSGNLHILKVYGLKVCQLCDVFCR